MFGPSDAAMGIFVLGSLPLVWQDHRDLGVGWVRLLLFSVGVQFTVALLVPDLFLERLWQLPVAIGLGTLMLTATRDGLGEGDVLFAGNLATLFSGMSLLSALAWGCIAGITGWGILALRRPELAEAPLPLIPALVVGAVVEYVLNRVVLF